MKHLVIDTETSGLFDFKRPADADGQPRLAELAMIVLDDEGRTLDEMHFYIRPDGWRMEPGATAINGLTDEFLHEKGVHVTTALSRYVEAIEAGAIIVAHNAQFDCKVMRAELRRAGLDDMFDRTPNICTMRNAQDFAQKLRRKLIKYDAQGNPTNLTGWPKLYDLCTFLMVAPPEKAHGALDDARAAARCFTAMIDLGFEPDGQVHRAKDYDKIRTSY